MKWFEMHKHTQYSMYDGFDNLNNIVKYAKSLGMEALGISDHGNACGVAQLYACCKKEGIKPIIGCEVYFQPTFNSDKRYFHLCLYATSALGYSNLCQIISEANDKNYYRYGKVTFEILEKYKEDIICTTACIGGFIPQMIMKGHKETAIKAVKKFKTIFGNNLYFEIQPIKIDELRTQEKVNEALMSIGNKYGIKCILTTDSHFTAKEDFDSYMMMHRMSKLGSAKGQGIELEHIENTYRERYMHSQEDIVTKLTKMHNIPCKPFLDNMEEIYNKVNIELDFTNSIPSCDDVVDCFSSMKQICLDKLKETGRYTSDYVDRLKHELKVIKDQKLCDYFMIVYDYVQWAKDNDIYVGPGRGSVGGSLVAEALGIIDIDPIVVGTDFERFLRSDKHKMPDIDIDFENDRQKEVIDYIIEKYKGRASSIITFGYYKSTNLINDLGKIYEIPSQEVARIKSILGSKVPDVAHFEFEDVVFEEVMKDSQVRQINKTYKDLVKHFCKLCGRVKYYGTHPAGVIVTSDAINKFVPMIKVKGVLLCSFDRYDIDRLGFLKFDILALKTLNVLHEIERASNDKFDRSNIPEKVKEQMYNNFKQGKTLGIFQLNKAAAQKILMDIHADNFQDIIAAISLNRPGTLQLHMHEQYAANKADFNGEESHDMATDSVEATPWYPYTSDTYGTIIYQEHVMKLCYGLAKMEPDDVDKLMKFKFNETEKSVLKDKFLSGAQKYSHIKNEIAGPLFDSMTLYLFNKGHAAGYAAISEWQMYCKVRHPIDFWYATMKWENDEIKKSEFMSEASQEGIVFFLPHVNYTSKYSVRSIENEPVVQMGYNIIKNVGEKATIAIEEERKKGGLFTSFDNFYDRCKSRAVTSRVIESLQVDGALEFCKKKYISRVTKFNATLYMKGLR